VAQEHVKALGELVAHFEAVRLPRGRISCYAVLSNGHGCGLILLDLNTPRKNGRLIIERKRVESLTMRLISQRTAMRRCHVGEVFRTYGYIPD
jgi:hypothetical protein